MEHIITKNGEKVHSSFILTRDLGVVQRYGRQCFNMWIQLDWFPIPKYEKMDAERGQERSVSSTLNNCCSLLTS